MSNGRTTGEATKPNARRDWTRRAVAASAATLLVTGATATLAGASGAQLQKITVKPYVGILANAKQHTLYVLSAEKGGSLHCKASCLSIWPPLLVKTAVTKLSLGAGVAGKIGFVKRSSTMKQVAFNGYPLYVFTGDSGPKQVNGQGIAADGGTWYLVNAAAKTASSTKMTGASPTG
jgi:predicted lipoprotein with Yx(FWY)xxD motif